MIDELVEARDLIIPEFSKMKPSEKYSACEKLVKLGVLSRTVWNGLDENRVDSEYKIDPANVDGSESSLKSNSHRGNSERRRSPIYVDYSARIVNKE